VTPSSSPNIKCITPEPERRIVPSPSPQHVMHPSNEGYTDSPSRLEVRPSTQIRQRSCEIPRKSQPTTEDHGSRSAGEEEVPLAYRYTSSTMSPINPTSPMSEVQRKKKLKKMRQKIKRSSSASEADFADKSTPTGENQSNQKSKTPPPRHEPPSPFSSRDSSVDSVDDQRKKMIAEKIQELKRIRDLARAYAEGTPVSESPVRSTKPSAPADQKLPTAAVPPSWNESASLYMGVCKDLKCEDGTTLYSKMTSDEAQKPNKKPAVNEQKSQQLHLSKRKQEEELKRATEEKQRETQLALQKQAQLRQQQWQEQQAAHQQQLATQRQQEAEAQRNLRRKQQPAAEEVLLSSSVSKSTSSYPSEQLPKFPLAKVDSDGTLYDNMRGKQNRMTLGMTSDVKDAEGHHQGKVNPTEWLASLDVANLWNRDVKQNELLHVPTSDWTQHAGDLHDPLFVGDLSSSSLSVSPVPSSPSSTLSLTSPSSTPPPITIAQRWSRAKRETSEVSEYCNVHYNGSHYESIEFLNEVTDLAARIRELEALTHLDVSRRNPCRTGKLVDSEPFEVGCCR